MSVSIINGNVYISNVRGGTYVSGTYNSGVQGNGELKAEPRNVESFDSVVLESSVDADVHCGHKGNQAVSVSGDSNLLDMVKTRVKDGVLHIGAEGSFSTQNPLKVKVQTDKLLSATLRASGDLAGGCTTSGVAYKTPGRVGDSPIIGSGLYVDNEVGAAGATGTGENIMRYCGSFMVVENMRQGLHPRDACIETVRRIARQDHALLAKGLGDTLVDHIQIAMHDIVAIGKIIAFGKTLLDPVIGGHNGVGLIGHRREQATPDTLVMLAGHFHKRAPLAGMGDIIPVPVTAGGGDLVPVTWMRAESPPCVRSAFG